MVFSEHFAKFFQIHGVRDSACVRKLDAYCKDMQNFRGKQAVLVVVFKATAVYNSFKSQ